MRVKKGFTIVELLVVIAILGVLLGIISSAAMSSIRNGRDRRADAMCTVLNQAIATYYAQKDKWPGVIEAKAKNGTGTDNDEYALTPEEIDKVFQEIVKESVGQNATSPLLDASALFVANSSKLGNSGYGCCDNHGDPSVNGNAGERGHYCGNQKCVNGVDFSEAVKKGGKHHISIANMAFGFQGPHEGKFCRFRITYNGRTDTVVVWRSDPIKNEL